MAVCNHSLRTHSYVHIGCVMLHALCLLCRHRYVQSTTCRVFLLRWLCLVGNVRIVAYTAVPLRSMRYVTFDAFRSVRYVTFDGTEPCRLDRCVQIVFVSFHRLPLSPFPFSLFSPIFYPLPFLKKNLKKNYGCTLNLASFVWMHSEPCIFCMDAL